MRIRIRGPQGVSTINIEETATWGELKAAIASSASVPEFDVKYGYPPKPLNTESIDAATHLSSLEIPLNGEQLTIVPINIQASLSNPLASAKHPPSAPRLPQSHTNAPKAFLHLLPITPHSSLFSYVHIDDPDQASNPKHNGKPIQCVGPNSNPAGAQLSSKVVTA